MSDINFSPKLSEKQDNLLELRQSACRAFEDTAQQTKKQNEKLSHSLKKGHMPCVFRKRHF